MKRVIASVILVTISIVAYSVIAANRVVVVPLGGEKPIGNAVAADVRAGKTFSNKDEIGIAGTMPARTLSPASINVSAGYYELTTLTAVENDLISENIKFGKSIFGVNGSYANPSCIQTELTECEDWCAYNFSINNSEKIACMLGCTTMAVTSSGTCLGITL